jgi:hypothetical protein
MPILCLEGPSAVGKSTTARTLADTGTAAVVGEVNELFARPTQPSPDWYLERQLDRWTRAVTALKGTALAVLDGDPFQPLWYTWVYSEEGWSPVAELVRFYRPRLQTGELGLPDGYILLQTNPMELQKRRDADENRRRHNFDKHLRLVEPQLRYFNMLGDLCPGYVSVVDAGTTSDVVGVVESIGRGVATRHLPSVEMFDRAVEWLSENEPSQ